MCASCRRPKLRCPLPTNSLRKAPAFPLSCKPPWTSFAGRITLLFTGVMRRCSLHCPFCLQHGWPEAHCLFKICNYFELVPEMPPPKAPPFNKRPSIAFIVYLTDLEDGYFKTRLPDVIHPPVASRMSHSHSGLESTIDVSPPLLNGFRTWSNTAYGKQVSGLARAFHLTMQPAGCVLSSFPHDPLRHRWENLRSSMPLTRRSHNLSLILSKHTFNIPRLSLPLEKALVCTNRRPISPYALEVVGDGHNRGPHSLLWLASCKGRLRPMLRYNLCALKSSLDSRVLNSMTTFARCLMNIYAKASFAHLGVREDAQALVEQGGPITRSGQRVYCQNSYIQPWTTYTGNGKGGVSSRPLSGAQAAHCTRGGWIYCTRPLRF